MDPAPKAVLALLLVGGFVGAACILRLRRPSTGNTLVLAAACLFVVVAVTHVCEAFQLLPSFGWGRPNSLGHYIDLVAALLGTAALLTGIGLSFARRNGVRPN